MNAQCSRRRLLQMAGALAASEPLRVLSQPFALNPKDPAGLTPGTRMYATVEGLRSEQGGIAAFVWRGDAWHRQQFVAAPLAGPVLADPDGDRIFVAHPARRSGPPAGSVQVLHVDGRTGRFTRGDQQPLALASRFPLALALSPDRSLLAVVAAGGVFSLLPVAADGTLAEVSAAHKQIAASLDRDSVAGLSFAPATHDSPRAGLLKLRLNSAVQCLHFDCRPDGLQLSRTEGPQVLPQTTDHPLLPDGVRSYVLFPALA